MNTSILDQIQLDPKVRASINYAKARCAIEEHMPNRAAKRTAKLAVVEFLNGSVQHADPKAHIMCNCVVFPDNSKAKF